MDYRHSHLAPTKGASYDESFRNYPYRKIVWDWEKEVLDEVIKTIISNRANLRYLDFACGTGRILSHLECHMEEAFGVDVSESMLSIAKESAKNSTLLLSDLTQENVFPENYFDLITAFRFFLNAQQELRESVLSVFDKILKDDGYLIINIHMNKGSLLEREIKVYRWLMRHKSPGFDTLGVSEVSDLLQRFNFKIIRTFHFGVLPIYREDGKLFINQINKLERLLSRYPSFLPVSRYVIYLCQPCVNA